MTTPRVKQIEELKQRLARLQAEQRAAEQRARVAASKATRAQDTRRKVLAGAYLLDLLGVEGMANLSVQGRSFDLWLTRADDRALFSLPPSPATPAPPGAGVSATATLPRAGGGSA